MSQLSDFIVKNGRSPQISLVITPLNGGPQVNLTNFMSYHFTDSILIPINQFQFTFTLPSVPGSIDNYVNEGDIAELYAGEFLVSTGLIDAITVETTFEGDIITVIGRSLIGQLEDQSAVNIQNKPMFGNHVPLATAVGSMIQFTRIRGLGNQAAPTGNFLFATEPGETKLSALTRFIEPLNCVIWSSNDGYLIVGRPNMGQAPSGSLVMDRTNRTSNVTSMKVTRASTQIPNIILALWTGQETVQANVPQQAVNNPADGPSTLRRQGHKVQKCVVVSTPSGSDPQSLSDANAFNAYGSNIMQAYALREIAGANVNEVQVQANMKGHFNDDLEPFMIDRVYSVNYDRGGVDEAMYLFEVEYSLNDLKTGPQSSLHLCRLGTIVAGARQKPVTTIFTDSGKLPTL
jgi:prophage tail gpP-like protein